LKRIGLLSDTHGWLDEAIFLHFKDCDEIWHAGDFGKIEIANAISNQIGKEKILRGVYGNVDGQDVRSTYPEKLHFTVEEVKVFMQHIGGYPQRYAPGVAKEIQSNQSQLFISGHSHILKIIYDEKLNCLHMNPGAAGREGWHKVRTVIRFVIDGKNIKDCEVIELGTRGAI
jgi:putative phosphoesterase